MLHLSHHPSNSHKQSSLQAVFKMYFTSAITALLSGLTLTVTHQALTAAMPIQVGNYTLASVTSEIAGNATAGAFGQTVLGYLYKSTDCTGDDYDIVWRRSPVDDDNCHDDFDQHTYKSVLLGSTGEVYNEGRCTHRVNSKATTGDCVRVKGKGRSPYISGLRDN